MLKVEYISPDGVLIDAFEMSDDMTLTQAACTICPDSGGKFPVPTIAFVGAIPAVKSRGDWDLKLKDAKVQFRQLPMGNGGGDGGSNPLQIVLQVVVIVVAALATWWAGGQGGTAAAGAMGLSTAAFQGLVGSTVMALGTLMVSIIAATNRPNLPGGQLGAMDAEQASPTYNINSSGNQARLYQTEPELFGRMKIVPDFVAQTWTEYVDNDSIGYFVYGLTRGECEVESLQFGETVFWKEGKFIESGYTNTGTERSIWHNQTLVKGAGYNTPVLCQRPKQETQRIKVDIYFPDGLCSISSYEEIGPEDSDGFTHPQKYYIYKERTAKVKFQVQQLDKNNNPIGGWKDLGTKTITRNYRRAFSSYFSFSFSEFSNWRIRASNVSENQSSMEQPKERMILRRVLFYPPDITIEFVKPGNPVTIFPDNVITSTEVNGQQLFAPNQDEYTGIIGPYTTNPPGTFTNHLALDFVFQQGVGRYSKSGSLKSYYIGWKIEAQKIDDLGNSVGNWFTLEDAGYNGATLTPQRITKTYDVEAGRYLVRVARTSNTDGDGRTLDTLLWGAMKATLPGTYEYPISCVAISIKANNALTQTASRQFSVIATRKLPVYDRKTKKWSDPQATRSWAAAISHVCKCEWDGRLKDSDIDLDTLWRIEEGLVEKDWHYDSYIDGPNLVWNLLFEMCQSQLVIPRLVGPILSFVEDAPHRTPVIALTPRNIMRNTFAVNYATWSDDTPDDVTMEYLDADFGFQQRDVTAILPESESKEPASIDILGITNRTHAHKVAVAYAAHNRWQRVSVECQIEALGRIINRGDICTVAHPRFKNTCAGALDYWDEASLMVCVKLDYKWPEKKNDTYFIENPQQQDYPKNLVSLENFGTKTSKQNVIELEKEDKLFTNLDVESKARLVVEEEASYIAFSRPNGSIWGPCKIANISGNKITLDSGDYSTLLLQGQGNPFEFFTAGRDRQPTTWTLYTARQYQRLMIVDSVTAQDALHYSLKLLNYDKRIYGYDDLPIPIWQGRGQLPDDSTIQQPVYVKGIIESESSIRIVWLPVLSATWYEVQISSDNEDWHSLGRISETQISATVNSGLVYARVKAGNDKRTSGWAYWEGDTELVLPAQPIPQLVGSYKNGSAQVEWAAIDKANLYAISLVEGEGDTFFAARQAETSFQVTPEIQTGGPYRQISFNVAAINENGSSELGTVVLSDPAPAQIMNADISINGTSATLNSVSPVLSGITGYVIAMGALPNFTINQVQELRQASSLPYSWTGMSSGLHYFRIAAKDVFYDLFHDPYQLNWSASIQVEIL